MIWFLPFGAATGAGGVSIARHLLRQGGSRHRMEAWFILALTWFPLAIWLMNQLFNFSR
jgi:hypothetical protein